LSVLERIDFYILPDASLEARWRFTGRLADKAWHLGHSVLVLVDDLEQARQLDQQLWALPEESFLPHRCLEDTSQPPTQVEISHSRRLGEHKDLLINLSEHAPEQLARFRRLAEVVVQQPELLSSSRKRFKHYQTQGYAVYHQRLGK